MASICPRVGMSEVCSIRMSIELMMNSSSLIAARVGDLGRGLNPFLALNPRGLGIGFVLG